MIKTPPDLAELVVGYSWKPIIIGHSKASTFLLEGQQSNYYLKVQPIGSVESLYAENAKMEWLDGKLPVPRVLFYGEDESNEYLLVTEVEGMNAADTSHRDNLHSVLASLGAGLKKIHRVPIDNCPFDQRLDSKIEGARNRVDGGLVDEDHFDEERIGRKAGELFEELLSKRPLQEEIVFAHGDFCLQNVVVSNGKVSGFIDWGRAGRADKYQDLALAIRSITSKFGKEFVPLFLDSYGMEELDSEKVFYYQLMDEFF